MAQALPETDRVGLESISSALLASATPPTLKPALSHELVEAVSWAGGELAARGRMRGAGVEDSLRCSPVLVAKPRMRRGNIRDGRAAHVGILSVA